MKITQPRLENVLHEDTEIQTALEKNDEDLTAQSENPVGMLNLHC